ncbi:MAG TPA: calcineurin [Blastocatellia bacterium]|nr:calcineurin [Blastocatellia bacterium]
MPKQNDPRKIDMVNWYDPIPLIKTGIQVATSLLLGSRVDYRVIESLVAPQEVFDYSHLSELWIDYVADLGDGWNPTYTVACLLARERLPLRGSQGEEYETRRGDILIMGGDEVYPEASRENYQERLVAPYQAAFPEPQTHDQSSPHLYAIPGNHDWYDGLVSFTRLFCQRYPRRRWSGWRTFQTRSYFALKLPHRWWLLGVDIQLEADIDTPQLEYFQNVARQMKSGDRVILCTPKPDWIYANIYDPRLENNLAYLERKLIAQQGARVVLKLTGDIHHYRRHESDDGQIHLIIAGGGGAFLHPTHGENVDEIEYWSDGKKRRFRLKAEFPSRNVSRCLSLRNLFFLVPNPWFGIMPGILYTALNWSMPHRLYEFTNLIGAVWSALGDLVRSPSAIVWLFVIVAGFILFTDTHNKIYRWAAGIIHAIVHLGAALVVAWIGNCVSVQAFEFVPHSVCHFILTAIITFTGGWLVGSFIMGLYLFVSLNIFGRHANEAFSSLRIQDYKNFLRLHLSKEGALTIFPIGIKKVPRKWQKVDTDTSGPRYRPEGREIESRLIEDPIRIA